MQNTIFMLFCAPVPILDFADLGQRNKNSIIKDISLMWLLRVWLQNNNINFWHGSAVVFISTIDQNNVSIVGILLHNHTRSSWADFIHGLLVHPQGRQRRQKIKRNILQKIYWVNALIFSQYWINIKKPPETLKL